MDTKPKTSVCRVCLSIDKKNMSLFKEHKSIPIYLHINSLTNVCVKEDDGLPDVICTSCLLDLDTAISFKEKCESSDLFLRTSTHSQSTDDNDFKYINVKKEEPQDETEHHEVSLNYSEPGSCHDDCDEEDKPIIHHVYQPKDTHLKENSLTKVECFEQAGNDLESDILDVNGDYEDNIVNEDDKPSKKLNKVELGLRESRAIDLQLQCDDCKGYFKSKCKLRVHWKKVHLKEALRCHRCKRSFTTYNAYNRHKQRKIRNCIVAGNFRIEVEGKKRLIYCKECDYKSPNMDSMRAHWTRHTGERAFKCDLCTKAFSQQSSLLGHKQYVHKQNHKKVACPYCGKLFVKSDLSRHLKSHQNYRFPCKICQKVVKSKASLSLHMIRHSGVKSLACEICAMTFYTGAELIAHKRRTHFKHKYTYNCDKCSYKCHTASTLHNHKAKHNDPNNTRCDLCGKFFKNMETFNIHMKTHTQKKQISCPHCDAKFCHRSTKNSHIKRHHSFLSGETEIKVKSE